MGFLSAIGNAIKSGAKVVADTVVKTASYVKEKAVKAYEWAKEKAAQACDWVAEKGEKFIADIKETYQRVKPYIKKARPWLDKIAKVVDGINLPFFPWVAEGLRQIGKALDKLSALENSPLAKNAELAIKNVINTAQFVKGRYLTEEEVIEAKVHQKTFEQIAKLDLEVEQQKALAVVQMLNNYAMLKTDLRDVLEMGVSDFQHYLRLRATQKLLDEAEQKLTQAQTVEVISDDDVFLVEVAEKLLVDSELSTQNAIRLDDITQQRFGKSIIPFVFEELMVVWVQKQNSLEKEWSEVSSELSKIKVEKTRLEVAQKVSGLTDEENKTYQELLPKLMGLETKLARVDKERRSMKSYVYAAEGFMQILEKDAQTLIDEEKEYLIDDSAEIAAIIIRVASNNVDWDMLNRDEQILITDYANIFIKEGKDRAETLAKELEMEI